MREKREIFKKERLPVYNIDSDSDDKDIIKENKPRKKSRTQRRFKSQRKLSKHCEKRSKNKEEKCAEKISKIDERRSFISSKNRLTMGIYNQGKQSKTIYREPEMSKVFEKMSSKLKAKTNEDMSKVLDCSSFQIKPLQACIADTKFDDFNLPDSAGSSYHSEKGVMRNDLDNTQTSLPLVSLNCNGHTNEDQTVNEVPERMEVVFEPQLEDITQRLMNSLEPCKTFGKDHLQDIRDELKGYYRKSMSKQEGSTTMNTINNLSVTPVQFNKIPTTGRRLYLSSISRIGRMSRDLLNTTEYFHQENCDDIKNSVEDNVGPCCRGEALGEKFDVQPQLDVTQYEVNDCGYGDILSMLEENCSSDFVTKYSTVSPLKKPSLVTPSPPVKLSPRKLF